MNIKPFALVALASLLALNACKNDKEDDVLPPQDKDYTGLVLNEICGKQDPDNDWVEILNTTTKTIDLSGVQLQKTDEEGISEIFYTFSEGATITAGTYKILEQLNGDFTVGISNSKQVGIALLAPSGTTINAFDRDADVGANQGHASGGSYARMPNGIGSWKIVTTATPGTANKDEATGPVVPDVDYTGLIINEICGLQVPDNDWIEILNTSDKPIDLNGVQVQKTDEEGVKEIISTFAEGKTIDAGAFLVISKENGDFSAGISNKKQVGVALLAPSGAAINAFDRDADVGLDQQHESGGSYARIPNGSDTWKVVATATPGAANNDGTPEPGPDYTELVENLVLNELNGNDPKYIELYNKSDKALDIAGVIIRKDDKSSEVYVAPAGTTIAAHGFLMLPADQPSYGTGFTSGLSAKKSVKIELFAPDGTTSIDVFKNLMNDGSETWGEKPKYNGETNGQSYARYPDGTGDWYLTTPTQDAANTQGAEADKITW